MKTRNRRRLSKTTQTWCGAASLLFVAGACAGPSTTSRQPRTDSTSTPASAAGPFPFPSTATGELHPSCVGPEQRLRAGLATEADVWLTVVCETARLPPDDVDKFVRDVRAYLDKIPTSFRRFPVGQMPKDLSQAFTAEERASWGPTIMLVADDKAVATHPELRNFTFLGSGGLRGVCAPWDRTKGHYQVTTDVLGNHMPTFNLRFSQAAMYLVADASQDPDLFDWNTMEAHAQTAADSAGRATVTIAAAQLAWVNFVAKYIELAATECGQAAGQPDSDHVRRALYFTGYALHAIEDAAPHRGRTNPEHSFNAHMNANPDIDPGAIDLATEMAETFMRNVLTGRLKSCPTLFASYSGDQVAYSDKIRSFGKQLQLTPTAILDYLSSWKNFEPLDPYPTAHIRWFGPSSPPRRCADDPDCAALLAKVAL
jgi:hypothetical protein